MLRGFLYESSSLFGVIRFACEISCFLAAYFSYEISWFWAVTSCLSEMSCLLSVTRFQEIILWESVMLYLDEIKWPEHCLVIEGGWFGGFGLVNRVVYVVWRMCCFRWAVRVFSSGFSSFRLLFLRVDCECNGPSFLATVFNYASKFSTSSICGYSWHRSTVSNKPSPLSTSLCACPAGTYCPLGTLAASSPLTCTVGSYCAKASTATSPCPAGVVEWDPG